MFGKRAVAGILSVVASGLGACSSLPPMSTSLVDLTFETKYHADPLFPSSQIVGINGLVPSPDVGLNYYYPPKPNWWERLWGAEDTPPYAAIAVSRDHSFRMVGTLPDGPKAQEQVADVRFRLETIAQLTSKQASLLGRIAALTAVMEKDSTGEGGDTRADGTDVEARLQKLRQQRDDCEDELVEARDGLADYLKENPGVLIARWTAKKEGSAEAKAGELGSLTSAWSSAQDGFVILGGIRVSMLAIGDDFAQMVARMAPSAREEFKSSVMTTHVLQAKCVAYVAAHDFNQEYELVAKVAEEALGGANLDTLAIGRIELQLAIAQWASIGNSATFGPVEWKKEPFCFVAGHDLAGLDRGELDGSEGQESGGYMTVIAQLVYPGRIVGGLSERWEREFLDGLLPPGNRALMAALEKESGPPRALEGTAPKGRATPRDADFDVEHEGVIDAVARLESGPFVEAFREYRAHKGSRPPCVQMECAVYGRQDSSREETPEAPAEGQASAEGQAPAEGP